MKKATIVFFILCSFVFVLNFSFAFAGAAIKQGPPQEAFPEAGQLAQDFTKAAMSEFKSIDDTQLSYPEVRSRVQKYAQKFTDDLLNSGVDLKAAGMIIQKASVLYGQTLVALFDGKDFNLVIQEYAAKLSDIFSKQHLNVAVQSKIVDMTSENLESMATLFENLEGEGPPP